MSEAESEPSLLSCIRIRKIARSAPAVLKAERACQFLVASLNPPAVDAIPDQSILASNLYQELAPVSRHRYILLQREVEQRLAGYLHLVSLRYYLRPGSDPRANPRADRRASAATGKGADDRSHCRSAHCSLRGARPARLASEFVFSCHDRHRLPIHHDPSQLQP